MTTPILPTKTALAAYTFSPAQLIADVEVKQFLTVENSYDFVLALITAFRSGTTNTYDIDGKDVITPATSFMYISDATTITTLVTYLTDAAYGYNYTVTQPTVVLEGLDSTYETATTGFAISSGPNIGKKCILVARA